MVTSTTTRRLHTANTQERVHTYVDGGYIVHDDYLLIAVMYIYICIYIVYIYIVYVYMYVCTFYTPHKGITWL